MMVNGIKSFLSSHAHIDVVGEAKDGEEAISRVKSLSPDVILMDIMMPNLNGLDATGFILDIDPEVKIIIVSMYDDAEYVRGFLESGARGYLLKEAPPSDFIRAIDEVAKGGVFISPKINQRVLEEFTERCQTMESTEAAELSPREEEVLRFIGKTKTMKEIADTLCLSVNTIRTMRQRIMRKLDLHTTPALVEYAIRKYGPNG